MKLFCSLFLLLTICFACKKDKAPTRTELLTSAQWKYEDGGIDQDRNGTIDIPFATTGIVLPCMTDNTGTFNSDGTGTTDEGPTKCDPSIPQTAAFTWQFKNNETEMQVYGSGLFGLGGQFKILELSETKFRLSKDTTLTFPGVPSIPVSLLVQLKH